MMKRFYFIFTGFLCCVLLLSGCETSTMGGATDVTRKQLLVVSTEQVNEMGTQAYNELLEMARATNTLNTHEPTTRRVRAVADRLIERAMVFRPEAREWGWQVNVVQSDEPKAYCLPGGKILIYSGLITRIHPSDDELAAVIGHEMAHALREHTREELSQKRAGGMARSAAGILIEALSQSFGDATGYRKVAETGHSVLSELSDVTKQLTLLSYSRVMEEEADVLGMELMARAGYNPNAAIMFWKKMGGLRAAGTARQSDQDAHWSSHPSDQRRIAVMEQHLRTLEPIYVATFRQRQAAEKAHAAAAAQRRRGSAGR